MARFVLSAFADEISKDLGVQMDVLDAHGVKYIEFRSADKPVLDYTKQELEGIKERLDSRGFKVSAVGSPIGKVDISVDFDKYLDKFKWCMEVAHILGTRYIRMFSFYPPKGKADEYESMVVDRIGKMADMARAEDLVLLHENEKDIYGDTADRCLKILKGVNSPNLWATFDPANFIQCGVVPYPDAYELLKDYIKYVHIKDAKFDGGVVTPVGQGDGRVEELLKSLYEGGFEGFLSIEPHLNNSLPGGGPELFGVAYKALKDVLDRIM